MNGPAYLVFMPQDELPDVIRQAGSWQEAMDLREQGGIVYEQAPRGPTPTCDLLRAAIAEVAAKGGA